MKAVALALVTLAACSHKDQVQETTPKNPGPEAVAKTEPPQTATTTATPTTPPADNRPALTPIYFEFNEAQLTPAGESALRELGDWMNSHRAASVTISGYADERGTVEYNLALGSQRAQIAQEYLLRLGVDRSRVKTISYGKEHPAATGHDEESWAKNRRDEFELAGAQAER
jgi:peptidoglycan-associated lipoprotein